MPQIYEDMFSYWFQNVDYYFMEGPTIVNGIFLGNQVDSWQTCLATCKATKFKGLNFQER